MDRRLLLAWAFVPVAFYAYACSSDEEAAPPAEQDGGGSSSGGSSSGGSSSGGSSSGGQNDAGEDADGGNPLTCVGNPLAEDAGTGDGGASVSADAGTIIVNAPQNFLDGPQFTDLVDGGALVYSEVFGTISPRIVRVPPTGGVPTQIRATQGMGVTFQLPIGNAIKGTNILTTVGNPNGGNTGQTPGILVTDINGDAGAKINVPANVEDPNDLVVTKDGIIFFTDPAYQSNSLATGVYRVNTDGGVDVVKSYTGDRPDGIALSPDEKVLYVAMAAAKRIERWDVGANGATTVANPAAFPATYVDDLEGIAVDTAGNLWVAESRRPGAGQENNPPNGGRVEVFAPDGKKWGEIVFASHRPIAVAFGGADNKTVYVVANANANADGGAGGAPNYSGHIFTFTSRCAGVR